MRRRLCSECGGDISHKRPQSKTCGQECRTARSKRLRSAQKQRNESHELPEHQKRIQEIVRGERDDVVEQVVAEEVRPVVREAITEETLRAIRDLVGLTPTVVDAIEEDLASEDPVIRQRAYTLVAKYTFGKDAVAAPTDSSDQRQLIVNFALPRPGDHPTDTEDAAVEAQVEEIRQCDRCGSDKPVTEFVAGSSRCVTCYEEMQAQARQLAEGSSED